MTSLYNVVFVHNPEKKKWFAFKRENWSKYWSDFDNCKSLSCPNILQLILLIYKTGDKDL